jgi:UDP-N-acetylmuramyl pentapeptide phosphotransferase/UDP-N-acetylglucosamine-1-phosphate transferase
MTPGLVASAAWPFAALIITLFLVRAAIVYAHRRGMLDQPGQRRSHRIATPRGGGIGVVLALLVCLPEALLSLPMAWTVPVVVSLEIAFALVALVGWWDDHRPLPVLPRFGAQLLAVLLFSSALLATGLCWWWLPLLLAAGAWSINLHNFMDGIDGLLAQQMIFVGAGLALISGSIGQTALAVGAAAMVASACGFWFYNRPTARIFMGDVGSGSIGLLIFAFGAMLWRLDHALVWPVLILSSTFVLDATLTLVMRMLAGKRWYSPHREHLYQWMTRRGGTHVGTDIRYMAWNLLIAGPAAWWAFSHLNLALPITIGFYLCASALWLLLKRRCLRRNLPKDRHVAA